jgi:enoyl-CoA hydratase/carnithine racemase
MPAAVGYFDVRLSVYYPKAMTQDAEVLYEVVEHIATITLNRPERMNTISRAMLSQLVPAADLAGAVRAIAEEIASNAPLAVQASKRMMRMGLNESFDDHVHHVFLQLLSLLRSEDAREGMRAFMEKRKAVFGGR